MFQIVLIIGLLILSAFLFSKSKSLNDKDEKLACKGGGAATAILAIVFFISLSVVYVGKDEIVLKDRIYFGDSMPIGQVVALEGQKGAQADVIMPGFKFIPFVRFIYDLESVPMVEIPENQYGLIVAKDGKPLSKGQVIAKGWDNYNEMINATTFLTKGGQKGTQLTVLPPGKYPINTYLFKVQVGAATQVKTGEVAVIRSNVQTEKNCAKHMQSKGLDTALVPKGCKGVWNEPLYQGMYYLNRYAYVPTIISTRAQVWAYKGGYTTKKISLTVMDDGSITQKSEDIEAKVPANAADKAINVRVEGWTVPVEGRITVQVKPKNAPIVVAGVGTLQSVEDKITTPNIRDSLRTIGGEKGAKVLDFVSNRASIAKKVMADIRPNTEAAGVTILDFNLGEPAIPPELLLANQRKQIAGQLKKTYTAEKETQRLRIDVEKQRVTANNQKILVTAKLQKEAARDRKEKRRLEGEGEKLYMTQVAAGEKARKNVLGEKNVVMLKALEIISQNPAMIKVPNTVVNAGAGTGAEFTGAAAMLGSYSNAASMLRVK